MEGGFVELALAGVELSPEWQAPQTATVTLVELEGSRRLEIVMGRSDGVLVQEALAGTPPPRPRTADLLAAVVQALGGIVERVAIVDRRAGGIYHAQLLLRRPDGEVERLDCRPSDGLNVALRSPGAGLEALEVLLEVPPN